MATFAERIRAIRSELSPSFLVLADFLLDSYSRAAFLNATELAHALDLDPATVVRFAQRLDYAGYPELQREIRQRVEQELWAQHPPEADTPAAAAEAALVELEQALAYTRRSFPQEAAEAWIRALDQAERVVLMAEGLASSPALSLARWLESAGYTVHLTGESPSDLASALVGARKGDLVLAVEVAEQSPILARALGEARRAGMHTAALVAVPSSPATAHAELVLSGHAHPDPGVRLVVVQALVQALAKTLSHARPGRFAKTIEKVNAITRRLSGEQT
ncbi:MAG TPA: MurR/RpiR family transcriptional regulator [Anaerolineales bacterium]